MFTDTMMQIELLSFIDSIKPVYGYHDNDNDGWTLDTAGRKILQSIK